MRLNRTRGFTFVEVMVALAVVSIALLGLLQLHVLTLRTAASAQAKAQAVLLAQAKMAEISGGNQPGRVGQSGRAEVNGLTYAWRTEMTSAVAAKLHLRGLKRLRVAVTWASSRHVGREKVARGRGDDHLHCGWEVT
jgi:general secretion pathway protein I